MMLSQFDVELGGAQDALTLALVPDPASAQIMGRAAEAFAGAHRLAGRQAHDNQLDLPPFELGRYASLPYGIVRQAQEAARRISLPAAFDVVFDRVDGVRRHAGRWTAVLAGPAAPELPALHADLAASLERSGLGRRVEIGWRPQMAFLDTTFAIPTTPIAPILPNEVPGAPPPEIPPGGPKPEYDDPVIPFDDPPAAPPMPQPGDGRPYDAPPPSP